jgi:Glyoxalase/Bleomycin resistance protein/Dioxygenase superfamily
VAVSFRPDVEFVQQFELQADVSGEGPFTTSHHDLTAPAWLRREHRVVLVRTASLSYLGLVGVLTWQALRGRPVVAPDAQTLGTDDVRAAYEELRGRGVRFPGEPYRYPWGLAAILLDQDGSPLLLQQESEAR